MTDSDNTLPIDPNATLPVVVGIGSGTGQDLPERVGRYHPLRIIGRGGMGVVYEAEQEGPRSPGHRPDSGQPGFLASRTRKTGTGAQKL